MTEHLAIHKELDNIVELAMENDAILVEAKTGSGKSIGVPHALVKSGAVVFCTQPTIPAAQSLSAYQTKLLKGNNMVGFAAEGRKNYDGNTKCVYATTGHVVNVVKQYFKAGKARNIDFCHVLMIDEVHTGTKDNSLLIDLLKEAIRQKVEVPNIIFATATSFGIQDIIEDFNAKIFRSDFHHYGVRIVYNTRNYDEPDDDHCFNDTARIAVEYLNAQQNHGIVFCSGSAEVEDIVDNILKIAPKSVAGKHVKILPCYSQCKPEQIEEAIQDENGSCIKIVVATNILESSLTVPNVSFIVDMMTEKRMEIIHGRPHLGTTYISKNSADQRKGRTGRTIKGGICHRMCTEDIYKTYEDYRPLEITRSPLEDVVITCLTIGLEPARVITDMEPDKLEAAKQTLIQCGCIEIKYGKKKVQQIPPEDEEFPSLVKPKAVWVEIDDPENFTVKITNLGHFVSRMPLNVRNAAALFNYMEMNKRENYFWPMVAIIVTDLYGPPLFWMPRKNKNERPRDYAVRMEVYKRENFADFMCTDPLMSTCAALKDCLTNSKRPSSMTFREMKEWAVDNSCNNKKLREIMLLVGRIQKIIQGKKYSCEFDPKLDICPPPKLFKAFETPYCDKMITNHYYSYVASDGRVVNIDTVKSVFNGYILKRVIPLSEIQFKDKSGIMRIMISLWISADEEIKDDE